MEEEVPLDAAGGGVEDVTVEERMPQLVRNWGYEPFAKIRIGESISSEADTPFGEGTDTADIPYNACIVYDVDHVKVVCNAFNVYNAHATYTHMLLCALTCIIHSHVSTHKDAPRHLYSVRIAG